MCQDGDLDLSALDWDFDGLNGLDLDKDLNPDMEFTRGRADGDPETGPAPNDDLAADQAALDTLRPKRRRNLPEGYQSLEWKGVSIVFTATEVNATHLCNLLGIHNSSKRRFLEKKQRPKVVKQVVGIPSGGLTSNTRMAQISANISSWTKA